MELVVDADALAIKTALKTEIQAATASVQLNLMASLRTDLLALVATVTTAEVCVCSGGGAIIMSRFYL